MLARQSSVGSRQRQREKKTRNESFTQTDTRLSLRYGVFLTYYELEGVSGSKSGAGLLPLVGTFSSGLMCKLRSGDSAACSVLTLIH